MGSLLTFVNAVADEVKKTHPDVMVGTLAYQYSRKAPGTIRPRPDVQIQLCSIECCQIHSIDDPDCGWNVPFCRDLAGWGKISKDIYVWNYNVNFMNYMLPCPNLRGIEKNVRHFVVSNAKGVFMQAAGFPALGAEFSELRNYIITKLLWNPDQDGEVLMDEFLTLHYGKAAGPIRRFIDLIHDNAENKGIHMGCWASAADYGIDETIAAEGLRVFEEAMASADSAEVRTRVEKTSACAYRAAIEPVWDMKDESELDPALAERMRPLVKRFFEICDKYGITRSKEIASIKIPRDRLREVFGLSATETF